jgi:hypothetical protein
MLDRAYVSIFDTLASLSCPLWQATDGKLCGKLSYTKQAPLVEGLNIPYGDFAYPVKSYCQADEKLTNPTTSPMITLPGGGDYARDHDNGSYFSGGNGAPNSGGFPTRTAVGTAVEATVETTMAAEVEVVMKVVAVVVVVVAVVVVAVMVAAITNLLMATPTYTLRR